MSGTGWGNWWTRRAVRSSGQLARYRERPAHGRLPRRTADAAQTSHWRGGAAQAPGQSVFAADECAAPRQRGDGSDTIVAPHQVRPGTGWPAHYAPAEPGYHLP